MTVTDVRKDTDTLTLTIAARFEAPVERIWRLWSDPRQLERWWGPPTYPATFVEHDLSPGGRVFYFMTGPGGERHHGWWRILDADPPHHLRFDDGFADAEGNPLDSMPTMTATVAIAAAGEGTEMTVESRFASREDMDKLLKMGIAEGMSEALGQIDGLLAGAGIDEG